MTRRALVGCETSGAVRRALRALGWDAWSCDLLPADDDDPHHIQGDVLGVLDGGWDLGIFHPPCTYLSNSSVVWFNKRPERWEQMRVAAEFFRALLNCRSIPRRAIENPIMHKYAVAIIGRRQDQIIQPWQFGHGETKATCLWLEGLPPLLPTQISAGRYARIHRMAPSPDRWKLRSQTYAGIAQAMAVQWGGGRRD